MVIQSEEIAEFSAIPTVSCPRCETNMRLAMIKTAETESDDVLMFECSSCDFSYQKTIRVERLRALRLCV